ncbi:bifunctional [glutamine synthetase] adenylyltransferase/[glutamine synthetase]-adenylyl-L-tyrosine phosphorylase [Caulobacter sp. SLTY]|uniref:bifunctional [glutamine synthetase] adenylyltransferase/[glutamine synthetase]-adenylyl-L-tyrosine phosphorylase n=1 Tax=Caulobacter sp. SLTY TaxID=2683262 RepID=UPI001411F909|nr:bifunctional [glutamine synthetase] adenylyltransferase/[glutamine synthetase]-adenylyl-L-tyrosine phosphorylase [Caulobacter sp. SLTY]NBB17285.1 bifunctional [glutamine synthetase] adenylyltransferase/[glutamine synthetase]-adenylyl-L-tyrosine phosphorylase [Caulobacter sp. SLTY]
MTALGPRLAPCGPVVDAKHAARTREIVEGDLGVGALDAVWPALEPLLGASPYLSGLIRRRPAVLQDILADDPEVRLDSLLEAARAQAAEPDPAAAGKRLRQLKAELHLLCALADVGGVWDLDAVTGALSRFADAALEAALVQAARAEVERGRLTRVGEGERGPVPGLFCLAMGKHGAFELNYSSDIDISVFYEPDQLPLADTAEPADVAVRITQGVARILQDRTADGYVFRVDLRLRPDPSSTPPAVPVPAAFAYYESVGQNWERAAFIKARVAAGDRLAGHGFLDELQAFIWRRNLDFASIADIHSIKRQIHAHKVDERLTAAGADLKLGRGGIREVEFYVQTQQLILGGRQRALRSPRTLDALAELEAHGHVTPEAAALMREAYIQLRALEHRVQMIADEHTHKLPEAPGERARVAALWGHGSVKAFDAAVGKILKGVNATYGELFKGEEPLSSRFGSLIFTGVEDDPETLATLKRMGFDDPAAVSGAIRGWHHGRIGATRTERGRELFTRMAPRLLEAAHATGAPNAAFRRFGDFFERLSSGVQVQSLFLAQPKLFELIVQVMAFAPQLAQTLARRPAALDALLDPSFFAPFEGGQGAQAFDSALAAAEGFEAAMDAARRVHREQAFRIGVQVIGGTATAADAGGGFADLADLCIAGLAPAALAETVRQGGAFPGEVAVIALGKCGGREMTARSDLDLMTLYRASEPAAMSAERGWGAETFYGRFTQRLIAALSAPTGEGGLYEVDMQLRPTGSKGPVAVSMAAFNAYYEREAETWEMLALTRARVAWASSPAFAADCEAALETALRRPRDRARTAADVREMRKLMEDERPPSGPWDLKLGPGGLVDIEFAAQFLQLAGAAGGGPLRQNTGEALAALAETGAADIGTLQTLEKAWRMQQDLSQLLKVALEDGADPEAEPKALKALLARAGGARDFKALKTALAQAQRQARAAYEAVVR